MNSSPYEEGWIIKVELSDAGEVEKLMDSDKYSKKKMSSTEPFFVVL